MLLLDASADDDRRAKILGDVEGAISSQGSLVGRHDWGLRPLAYEIRHATEAVYHLFQFDGPPELLEQLDRYLRITDGVTRFRIIKLRPGTPPAPEPRPEPRPESRPERPPEPAPAA
jgi:small subunit ribosomal protein S6